MDFQELVEATAARVWAIECAEIMIPAEEAKRRWLAFPNTGSNRRVQITYTVSCCLIALKEMQQIEYS